MVSEGERQARQQISQARTQISRARSDLASQQRIVRARQQALSREEQRLGSQQALRQARGPEGLIARQQALENLRSQRLQVSAFQQQLSGVEGQISRAELGVSRQERDLQQALSAPEQTIVTLPSGEKAIFTAGSQRGQIISPEGIPIGETTRGIFARQRGFEGGISVPLSTPFGEGFDLPGFTPIGQTPSGGVLVAESRVFEPEAPQVPVSIQEQASQTLAERERIRLRQIREAISRGDLPEATRIASAAGFDPFVTGVERALSPFFESEIARIARERATARIPGVAAAREFLGQPVTEETLQVAGASIFFAPAFTTATAGTAATEGGITVAEREVIIARELSRQAILRQIRDRLLRIQATTRTSQTGIIVRDDLRNIVRRALQQNPRSGDAQLRNLFNRLSANAESRAILEEEISNFFRPIQPPTVRPPTTDIIPTSGIGGGFPPVFAGRPIAIEEPTFVSGRVTVPQIAVAPPSQNVLGIQSIFEGVQQRAGITPREIQIQRFGQTQLEQQRQLQRLAEIQITEQVQVPRQQLLPRQAITPRVATIQLPGQRFLQLQLPRVPQVPRFGLRPGRPVGALPRLPLPSDSFIRTRMALSNIRGGVNVVVGKGKKAKVVAKNLPPNLALKTGIQRISKNITASFVLKPSGKQATKRDIARFRVSNQFRPGKQDPLRIVEKRQFRLDSGSEVAQIKSARRAKPRRRKR